MFNLIEKKQKTLYIGSQGVILKSIQGFTLSGDLQEIERETLIEVVAFNFDSGNVRVKCIKGIKSYLAEISYNNLLNYCNFEEKIETTPIQALQVNNYTKKVLDKESIRFLITQVLLILVGILIGKAL